MGEMFALDRTGDTRQIWDADKPDEVAAALAAFNSLTAKGYRAFRVKKDGTEGAAMTSFDPEAEKMILVPALQGG